MSSPDQLFLLADHIKLSLLERQRAKSLGLEDDSQDGHVSRSLEQFSNGISTLKSEQSRLEQSGDAAYVANMTCTHLPRLTIKPQRRIIISRISFIPSEAVGRLDRTIPWVFLAVDRGYSHRSQFRLTSR